MFTSAGEDRWHLFDDLPWGFNDVIFHRGRFLAVSWNGILHALDIKGGSIEVRVIMDPWTGSPEIREEITDYNQRFLVADDATGDLLQVWRNYEWTDDSCTTDKIKVVRCDQKQNRLIPLDNLGDRALFLGIGSSVLLSSSEVRGLRRNCIYLTDNWWDTVFADDVRTWNRDVGIYNMENATFEPYHPPDPRFYWPPPVWITPALS
uniref:KIB1-4 beta-propeller domain-containing protein n=1 Tax=Ananas comosus var. bracteatus TaxID=296719 RepID=A0A6V7Q2P3_ANACO|nr:unnamed protein product [Ananas comosus var. bracteatus]